jgi:hypothetical protein
MLLDNPKVLQWMLYWVAAGIPHPMSVQKDGSRTEPEGIAPLDEVWLITWRDSRNAPRTLTLGAYLHQYDFSFSDGADIIWVCLL